MVHFWKLIRFAGPRTFRCFASSLDSSWTLSKVPVGSRTEQAETSVENAHDGGFLGIFSHVLQRIYQRFQPWFSILLKCHGELMSFEWNMSEEQQWNRLQRRDAIDLCGILRSWAKWTCFGAWWNWRSLKIARKIWGSHSGVSTSKDLNFATRQSSSSVEEQQLYQLWLHGASCLSAMLQVGSMPIIQSMPSPTHAMLRGAPLVRVNHSHHHVRPEVCLMCFVPTVTEDLWDIVPSAMCFVLLNIGTAPPGWWKRWPHDFKRTGS